jgi:glycosyltransferase involved in cell wall biosynthesis/GT2 family glycosyltransferase
MARMSPFQRKFAKFRRAPKRFLSDSDSPVLRALATIMPDEEQRVRPRRLRQLVDLANPRAAIQASQLFDPAFYAAKYADVRRRRGDLLNHYVSHGAAEGRWPNAYFDPQYYARQAGIGVGVDTLPHYVRQGERAGLRPHRRFDPAVYLARYPDVAAAPHGPLEHFLRVGQHEGRRGAVSTAPSAGIVRLEHDLRLPKVAVLVPVYNGFPHVRRCIEAVLLHSAGADVELIVIDDASTDPRVRDLLDTYAGLPRVQLVRNAENLGFTRSVNRGLVAAKGRDVILLNSDAVVGPRYLQQLAAVAYGSPNMATATALSDNAGAFSTPKSGANPTIELMPVHDAARLCLRSTEVDAHSVPTGNGFCMYMRRDAIDQVGLLDHLHFPRGYGEENDWCMRAGNAGLRHAIALRAYVHHVNAVSFGADAKKKLRDDARGVLDKLHPDYGAQVQLAFGGTHALSTQRDSFGDGIERFRRNHAVAPKPRVLFVVSTLSGGTPLTNQDLMLGVSHLYEPLLLVSSTRDLQLFSYASGQAEEIDFHSLTETIGMAPHTSSEYDAVVSGWLYRHGVELLHVRHIAWHGLGLVAAAKRLGIPVIFSLHDFYTVCPSVNLTNGKDRWSDTGITSPHIIAPLWVRRDAGGLEAIQKTDPEAFLALWKRRMNAMLAESDAWVTTSPFARDVFQKNLPVLRERSGDFHVIPHGRDFERFLAPVRAPKRREPLRVLLPGNITESKGLHTVLEILRLDTAGELEVHLLGTARESLLNMRGVKNHGPYAREDFADLVSKIKPHVGLIISIWPETFCHTLTECWAAGVPVIGSNLGAVGERIGESGAGWEVDPFDAASIYALLRRIRNGEESWGPRVEALTRWQQTTAAWDVAAMAERYLDLYENVLHGQRTLLPAEGRGSLGLRARVALVVRGHFPQSMPTSHVRIATQVAQASGESVDYDWLDAAELVRLGVRNFDGVVVCRNAGPPEVLSALARQCKKWGVPLVLDLDDDLLNVPADKDPGGVYPEFAPALRELLAMASLTTLSTEPLIEAYAPKTHQVRLVPNRLEPNHWLTPVNAGVEAPAGVLEHTGPRILYMGSPTHREDLELVLPAFERLRKEHGAALFIVGITSSDPPPGVVALTPPNRRYDHFIQWFKSISRFFDIAIAPLTDAPFNRSKSALKFMEYAALGLPVVASDVEPYARVVRDGVDGLLVEADEDGWVEAVASLIRDPALRKRLTAAARSRAETEFACKGCVFDELPWADWRKLGGPG